MVRRQLAAAPRPSWAVDVLLIGAVAIIVYAVVTLAGTGRDVVSGERSISLSPKALPLYAGLSLSRMLAAYALAMIFTFGYAYVAAYNRRAGTVMVPLLDILQSIPLLSFLPIFLLSMMAIFQGHRVGVELAAILLIFTSQAWNITFSLYYSLLRIPRELRDACGVFQVNGWLRFRHLELPAAAIGLVWNSMLSWSNGWFFLMASEMFVLGDTSFQLPGLGSYLQRAAAESDIRAILYGLLTLVVLIVVLDRMVWQPLVSWSQKFKLEEVEEPTATSSVLAQLGRRSQTVHWLVNRVATPFFERLDAKLKPPRQEEQVAERRDRPWRRVALLLGAGACVGALLFGLVKGILLLADLDPADSVDLVEAAGASLARVSIAQGIALAWTLPVGVAIGMNRSLARRLQPFIQVAAAVPATALFPILLLLLLDLPAGLNIAAVVLLVLAAQWYLLFNIIAGASTIPQDLKQTAEAFAIRGVAAWRSLILPAVLPYLLTGVVVSTAASWNATIVAEYFHFGGKVESTVGLGASIGSASAAGNMPLLLASTLVMIAIVLATNRFLWKPWQSQASLKYTLEAV